MNDQFEFDPAGIDYIKKNFTHPWKFRMAMRSILPMGYLSKMKVVELNEEKCAVAVPYNKRNSNPFKSTFWAVLGMAAEMSSGALLTLYTHKQKESIAMLVYNMDAQFVKKATDITTFTCYDGLKIKQALLETIATREPQVIETKMTGKNQAGEDIAHFTFTWSVKARSKKK